MKQMRLQKDGMSVMNFTEADLKFEECRLIEVQMESIAAKNAKKTELYIKRLEKVIDDIDDYLKCHGLDEAYFEREELRMKEWEHRRKLREKEIDEMLEED